MWPRRVISVFLGEYQHTIDAKNRIVLPSKFRDGLGQHFVVTKGLDNCLFVYAMPEWEALHDKVKSLPVTDENVRRFVRFFFGGAMDVEPDSQGRVMIPANLREYAEIKKEIVSIGVSNRIEIWSKENWNAYNNDSNTIDNELAEKMAQLGI